MSLFKSVLVKQFEARNATVELNRDAVNDTHDIGFVGKYNDGVDKWAGLFRDISDGGKWKLAHGLTEQPTGDGNIDLANLVASTFEAGSVVATTGVTATTGGVTATAGGLTSTAGGLTVTAGVSNFDDATEATTSTAASVVMDGGLGVVKKIITGDSITAGTALVSGTTVTAGTGVIATTGGVTATAGGLTSTAGGLTVTAGISNFDDSTEATTSTAASVVMDGGLGVVKKIITGDSITAGTSLSAGTAVVAGTTVTAGTGVIATTGGLTATAGGITVTAGVVDINDTTGSTNASSGALQVAGGAGIVENLYVGGVISGLDTTEASSVSAAAFLTAGGAGIAKKLFVGGVVTFDDVTEATGASDGALVVAGGVDIAKNLYVGGDMVINGTTTTVNTETLTVTDNIVIANSAPSATKDGGFLVERFVDDIVADTADETGTAIFGTTTTITLAAGADATDDFYNGYYIKLTGGTGAGVDGIKITDYVGATKVATVDSWPVATPDATTTYSLYKCVFVGVLFDESANALMFACMPQDTNGEVAQISLYDGKVNNFVVDGNLTVNGGFTINAAVTTVTANHTVATTDEFIYCANTGATAITVTLPAITTEGVQYTVVKLKTDVLATVTVDGNGAETIEGDASVLLEDQYHKVTVVAVNSGGEKYWMIK